MEYALIVLYTGLQKLFNTFMSLEVAPDVTVGGIFIVFIILSLLFVSLGFITSAVDTNTSKGKKSRSKGEE